MRPQRPSVPFKAIWSALAAAAVFSTTLVAVAAPGPANTAPQARQAGEKQPAMLNDEQINLIKVYEVKLDEKDKKYAPRITIPAKALREFLDAYKTDDRIPRGKDGERAFMQADGAEQLQLMFDLRARDFYKHATVRNRIRSLDTWGSVHERYVLRYFQAHFGNGDVPGLYLFPKGRDGERIKMTNFYILTQTTIDGVPLLDRNKPEESLLLQWGLPREEAKYAAPEIAKWRPYFRDTEDKRFTDIADWIRMLYASNQGSSYGINDFVLPGQKPADD